MTSTLTINGEELREDMFAPELWAGLLQAAGKARASRNARAELDAFVADPANTKFMLAWQNVRTAKSELDAALETVKELRAAFASAQDTVNTTYPDQTKTYSHLVAVTTATAPVITGRVSAGKTTRTRGANTGNTGNTGNRGKTIPVKASGESVKWSYIAEDVLGIVPPVGSYSAPRRILDCYAASVKDPLAALKTYGVVLSKSDFANITIEQNDKTNPEQVAAFLSLGCTLA